MEESKDATPSCKDAMPPCKDVMPPCKDDMLPCKDATTHPCNQTFEPQHPPSITSQPSQQSPSQSTVFSRLTKQVIQHFIEEVNKDDNNAHIRKQVIDPLIRYSVGRIYPYMLMTATLFILTFFIAIAILVILLKRW